MELLVVLGVFFLVVLPVLAIRAYVRAERHGHDLARLSDTCARLTRRVFELEERLAQLDGRQPAPPADPRVSADLPVRTPAATPPSGAVADEIARPPAPVPVAASASSRRRDPVDWETLIAGRWMNGVGIVALTLAAAFFLRHAFEHEWIGPAGRVALGLLTGSGLIVSSQPLFRRSYADFADGIAGLGGGVLYLSFYAGWAYYELFTPPIAFAGMIVATLTLMLLAAGRDSQRIAVVALAGGFLAPILLGTGADQQIVLFTYVAALDAGVLLLVRLRQWRVVESVALAGTQVLFWGWYQRFWSPEHLIPTAGFATLFFVLFSALPLVRVRGAASLAPQQFVVVVANAFAYLLALRAMLWPEHRWTLTLAMLALAAAHLLIARRIARGPLPSTPPVRLLYSGLALMFATLAVPIRLDGRWITIAWAAQGAVLVWSGFVGRASYLRLTGLLLFGIVLSRLVVAPIGADRFLLNPRFLTLVLAAASFAAAAWIARSHRDRCSSAERSLHAGVGVAASALLLWALTADVADAVGRMDRPFGVRSGDLQALAIGLLWMVYGTALVVAGFRLAASELRWQGLPLVAVAAAWLLVQSAGSATLVLNPRFAAYVLAAVCLLLVGRGSRRPSDPADGWEPSLYRAAPAVLHLLLLVALSHEVWDAIGRGTGAARAAQSMGLSLLWAAYATVLTLLGMRRASPLRRWMALGLFGIVVTKVFFVDLNFLDPGSRILSFFVLGMALLIVSFLYTRRLVRARAQESRDAPL